MAPPALPHLSDADLSHLIDRAETRTHTAGDVLIEEGDRRRELLFVRSGNVRRCRDKHLQGLPNGRVLNKRGNVVSRLRRWVGSETEPDWLRLVPQSKGKRGRCTL